MADAKNKTQMTEASVEDFLGTLADEQRGDSRSVVEIFRRATGEGPKMWGPAIIGFGLRHLVYESGREMDWLEIGFSPRKGNITFYIGTGFPMFDELTARLGKHKVKGSCMHIKKISDVDEAVLEQLVEASIKHIRSID